MNRDEVMQMSGEHRLARQRTGPQPHDEDPRSGGISSPG
jgi:hypothetical protein